MNANIFSVVVNWNLKEDTLECVQSLIDAGAPAGSILVVDNNSSDGSVESIVERFGDHVNTIQTGKNIGYAGGVNLGIAPALDAGADWVFLLNNDTIVAPDIFQELQNAIDNNPEYSLVAPTIFYYDQPEIVWFYGENRIGETMITIPLIRDREIPVDLPNVQEVDFVSGCGMVVNRSVFDKVGMFNPELFMYGEEVDFLWRGQLSGFRYAVSRDARMWHKVSASAGKDQPNKRIYQVRNQNRFYRTYTDGIQKGIMFLFSILKVFSIALDDLLHGQVDLLSPLFNGWYEGWFGKQRGY